MVFRFVSKFNIDTLYKILESLKMHMPVGHIIVLTDQLAYR